MADEPWLDRERRLALLGVVVLLLSAAPFSRQGSNDSREVQSNLVPLRQAAELAACPAGLGVDAPHVGTLRCLDGRSDVAVAKAPGVPLVVNAWAYWCDPCRQEIPLLVDLAARAADRPSVVGVASDPDERLALEFIQDFGVHYPNVLHPDGDVFRSVGSGLPQTLFVTADGRVAHVERGEIEGAAELDRLMRDHLGVLLP